jgi:hypothetical protein
LNHTTSSSKHLFLAIALLLVTVDESWRPWPDSAIDAMHPSQVHLSDYDIFEYLPDCG